MKTKTLSILFALVMVLSLSVGVFAQDFNETWDENTVLTVFEDLDLYFPDLFADEDSNYLWADSGPQPFPNSFEAKEVTLDDLVSKAPMGANANAVYTFDECGDGLIKFDVTVNKMPWATTAGYYYGDENTTYIRSIKAQLNNVTDLGIKKCDATGGTDCYSVSYKNGVGHIKGYLTVPKGMILSTADTVNMTIEFSDYMTALWKVGTTAPDGGSVVVPATNLQASKKNYCQNSLQPYGLLSGGVSARARYDENTGEAYLQAVIRNVYPDIHRQNYVIPAEIYADINGVTQRIDSYTCKYTTYNTANAAPRTDYCKFGEGIAIADHGVVRLDITIDHLSGAILREAEGDPIDFYLRIGGMSAPITGQFEAVDFPCPPVSRMQVKDPLYPFMASYPMLSDSTISASGAYGVYENGVWGIYQKCGKFAYMMVRLKNDGIKEEVINLNNVAVAINGGTPMSWTWVLSSMQTSKGNKIVLDGGEEVILIGRAKVTDIPSQLNADTAMTGAVNFLDYGFYITGKVYSDHNNTRCVAAPN